MSKLIDIHLTELQVQSVLHALKNSTVLGPDLAKDVFNGDGRHAQACLQGEAKMQNALNEYRLRENFTL